MAYTNEKKQRTDDRQKKVKQRNNMENQNSIDNLQNIVVINVTSLIN